LFYAYVLKSQKDGRHYIGSTNNIERRIKEHNNGKSQSVRNRGPFDLVFKEPFESRVEAVKRELQLKSYKGGEAFKRLISQ